MAQFSIEINDADVFRVLDAVSANYNRPETVPNPSFNSSLPEREPSAVVQSIFNDVAKP